MATPKSELIPVLPMDDVVVLPHMTVTLAVEGDSQKAAIEAARQGGRLILLVPRVEGKFGAIGTVARLGDSADLPTGAEAFMIRGEYRARLGSGQADIGGALWVKADPITDPEPPTEKSVELAREYRALLENLIESRGVPQVIQFLRAAKTPSHLADLAGYSPDLTTEQKLEVLETLDLEQRLERLITWTKAILADASLKEQIRSEVAEGMEKTQRELLLRQQLEAIKKQLNEGQSDVVSTYRERIAKAGMPEAVLTEVNRELERLERTSEQNPEYGWIRTYLDWMLDIPWNVRSEDNYDLVEARRILDEDHTGLSDVKDRIIEFLAVRKLRKERGLEVLGGRGSGAIITLVGPPGVGKTSLGESVARALGRKFTRVSLGGIRDEADIRGHRRTYVGALPGRIVRALKDAGTMNPVIMLDEIDKIGSDWRGDPSSALLEVLDPAQNHTFRDHYLEVDLDLSDVLFIPTANVVDSIPGPLLDRMEIVQLDGYTLQEKRLIARDHLVARQLERNGLEVADVTFSEDALLAIVEGYTREAGVRGLERQIGKLLRKLATSVDSGGRILPTTITADDVRTYLGRPHFHSEVAERTDTPGIATGLAVTGIGGDVLFIEAASMPGEQGLTLTGQLGDVMKESAQIALSYVRSHAADLGIDAAAFNGQQFHVHVPAGAVPKDGPSAGITMVTALASLLSGRPVREQLGMTGEVTLQGKVLPIGGVKQKLLAAHRAGLKEVILPRRNEPDLDDVPQAVRMEIAIHLVSTVAEVLGLALSPATVAADAALLAA